MDHQIRRCSRFLPRAAASCAIRPGRSFRAVKLLPMKSTLSEALPRTRVAMSSSALTPPKGRAAFSGNKILPRPLSRAGAAAYDLRSCL